MKVKYFSDSDTLHIELYAAAVDETRDLDENTLLDLDDTGRLCAITIEHASTRMDIPAFSSNRSPRLTAPPDMPRPVSLPRASPAPRSPRPAGPAPVG